MIRMTCFLHLKQCHIGTPNCCSNFLPWRELYGKLSTQAFSMNTFPIGMLKHCGISWNPTDGVFPSIRLHRFTDSLIWCGATEVSTRSSHRHSNGQSWMDLFRVLTSGVLLSSDLFLKSA